MATALVLAGCQADEVVQVSPYTKSTAGAQKTRAPVSPVLSARMQTLNMDKNAPIMVRLFKEESKLEVWKQTRDGRYALLETFDICRWSGNLGPKVTEGDRQAPEGFYMITPGLMNPNSSYHLAFNIGFPNAYDRSLGRYGTNLMVHGACSSRGCYAMTDGQIEQIYALARDSFAGGQKAFQFQAYPFRMTPENIARHYDNPNASFWAMLKEGYDHFEVTRQVPKVDVCGKKYVFDAKTANGAAMSPSKDCPTLVTAPDLAIAVASKQKRDEARVAELLPKMRHEREREADRARKVLLASAKGKVRSPTAVAPLPNRRPVDGGGTAVMVAAADGISPPVYATSFSAPPGIEVAQVLTAGPVPATAQAASAAVPAAAPAVPVATGAVAVASPAVAGSAAVAAADAAPVAVTSRPAEVRVATRGNDDSAVVRPRVAEAGLFSAAPAPAAVPAAVAVAAAGVPAAATATPAAAAATPAAPAVQPAATETPAEPATAAPVRTASSGTSMLRGWFDGLFGGNRKLEQAAPAAADVQVASAGEAAPAAATLPTGLAPGVLPEPRPGRAVASAPAAAAPASAPAAVAAPVAAVQPAVAAAPVAARPTAARAPAVATAPVATSPVAAAPVTAATPAVQPVAAAAPATPVVVPASAPAPAIVPAVPTGATVPTPSAAVRAPAGDAAGLRATAQTTATDPAVKPTVPAGEAVAVTSAPRPSVQSSTASAPLVLDPASAPAEKANKSVFARAFDLFSD